MSQFHNSLRRISATLVGLVFFVSGLLKLMDPVGVGLVVSEYFKFFHIDFLDGVSIFAGTGLAILESLTGLALVTGVFRKLFSIVACSLVGAFTLLTFALLLLNPEMDCGCFGEAVHLSHFQSFAKNIVLCLLSLAAFVPFRDYGTPPKRKYISFSVLAAFLLFVLCFSLWSIPFTDFTTFRLSSRLSAAETGMEEEYEAVFVYEKAGQQEQFSLDNLPDSSWTYLRTETRLLSDGAAAHESPSLSFSDGQGNYMDSLALGPKVLVQSIYNPDELSSRDWQKITSFSAVALSQGFTPLILVRSSIDHLLSMLPSNMDEEEKETLVSILYSADFKELISLNRSNGGVSYFDNGYLIQRWGFNQLPDEDALSDVRLQDPTDQMLSSSTKGRLLFQASFLISFAVLLLI